MNPYAFVVCIYIYIHITCRDRERDRERDRHTFIYMCVYIHTNTCRRVFIQRNSHGCPSSYKLQIPGPAPRLCTARDAQNHCNVPSRHLATCASFRQAFQGELWTRTCLASLQTHQHPLPMTTLSDSCGCECRCVNPTQRHEQQLSPHLLGMKKAIKLSSGEATASDLASPCSYLASQT